MRIAADTNVVVRYLTADEPSQFEAAARSLEAADSVFLSTIVLCETVWVLRRLYGFKRRETAGILRELLDSEKIEVDRRAAETGLAMLEAGGDFADGVIRYEAGLARCDVLVTFDRGFAGSVSDGSVVLLRG